MVNKRNRNLELKKYFESLGIIVNIGKNKARGNKGFFKYKSDESYRIDISKTLSDDEISSVMLHEFAHYFHYQNDKTLKKLDFVFGNISDNLKDELINITVKYIPKDYAKSLFDARSAARNEVNKLKSQKNSIINYYKTKHYEREYSRISAKISKLNRYYQSPSELFARFVEMYYSDLNNIKKIAPNASSEFSKKLLTDKNFCMFNEIDKILNR